MSEPKYKIFSLWYTKPIVRPTSNGEITFGRTGVSITLGGLDNFGDGLKKVEDITFDDKLNSFMITFPLGGLKIVPMHPDMEITYELIKVKK